MTWNCLLFLSFSAVSAYATPIALGTAANFAILAGAGVTNTGPSVIDGNLGTSPTISITGFPPGIVNGTIDDANAAAIQAQIDLTTAYDVTAGETPTMTLTGMDLGGLTLTPGVYFFMSSAQLTGTLLLDAEGDPNAMFVFQMGSTLTTASNAAVVLTDGANGNNIFWQVGSSATLGTNTSFEGNLLAKTSITLNAAASIGCGRALASNGAVTLETNSVSIDAGVCETAGETPEPGTGVLLGTGLLLGLVRYARR